MHASHDAPLRMNFARAWTSTRCIQTKSSATSLRGYEGEMSRNPWPCMTIMLANQASPGQYDPVIMVASTSRCGVLVIGTLLLIDTTYLLTSSSCPSSILDVLLFTPCCAPHFAFTPFISAFRGPPCAPNTRPLLAASSFHSIESLTVSSAVLLFSS